MKVFLTILFLVATISTVGQISKSSAERSIDEILASGVDTLIYYKSEQGGGIIPNLLVDTCIEYETEVFLWRFKGKTYLQKFAMCLDRQYQAKSIYSPPTLVESSKAFDILANHYENIESDHIVPAVFKWSNDGVEVYEEIRSSHQKTFALKLYLNGNILSREFNKFSLMDSIGKIKNLNYTYNYCTWLNKLKEQVEYTARIGLNATAKFPK